VIIVCMLGRLLAAALVIVAQPTLTGEWALEFTTPRGHAEYTMYLTQEGPRVTGHLTSEYGEQQLRVTLNGDDVRIMWSEIEGGKTLDITLTGTVKGDAITGTAKLGTVGEGPFRAERTGS
jgi:hypothetical protein